MDNTKPILIFAFLAVTFIGLLVWALMAEDHDREQERLDFMQECERSHHTHFECRQMWRVGENHDTTTVVPMPVYVGH